MSLSPAAFRLYQLKIRGRWLVAVMLWLTLGLSGLWGLQIEIARSLHFFTWASLKYLFAFRPLPSLQVILCLALSSSILVRQSVDIIWGLTSKESYRLEQASIKIMEQPHHWLYRWFKSHP
ncbi:MAG: hypothetical protein HC796_11645 [Synechococcaceae cyanobacterium RL_1_2]|nr:hypothetical protein [Synechococcaceae cyanobacterium RL_1_2]